MEVHDSPCKFMSSLAANTCTLKIDLIVHFHFVFKSLIFPFLFRRSHTSSGISRHRRSHTNSKPYQCHLCYAYYADKKRLQVHLMKHNNEKPFSCPNCKYSTNRNDNLKIHIRRNHMDTASFSYSMPEPVPIMAIENPFAAPDFSDFIEFD